MIPVELQTSVRVLSIGHSYVVANNRAMMREVAKLGHDVTVAAPAFFHGDLRTLDCEPEPADSPLRLVRIPVRLSQFIHLFQYGGHDLRRLLAENFDIVHAWEEPYIYAGYQIARAVRRTSSRFCFRTAQNLEKRYPPPFSFFERRVIDAADGWIAGAGLVYEARTACGYPADRGRVITLAVDTTAFAPLSAEQRIQALAELGLRPPVLGFLGRLTPDKGIPVLLAALERLPASLPWSVFFMGSGPLESHVRQWADQRGWADRVHVRLLTHGEVPRFLGAVDILVAPSQTTRSWREQFGRMIVEAFACGVPVIGSDSGEIPHIIGDAGRVIAEKDAAAWASAIAELLERPDARHALGATALARAQQYSTATIGRQLVDFYEWIVRARSPNTP